MTLDVSVSEGDPLVTGAVNDNSLQATYLAGSNQATEMVMVSYKEFEETDRTVQSNYQKFFAWNDDPLGSTVIVDRSRTYYDTSSGAQIEAYLRWYQSVAYQLVTPSRMIEDLLVYKGGIDHGVHRVPPNGTFAANNWSPSLGNATLHAALQTPTNTPPNVNEVGADYIAVIGEPEACTLSFTNLMPSNCDSVKEIKIKAWITQDPGTTISSDGAWGIDTELFHTSGGTAIKGTFPNTSLGPSIKPILTSVPQTGPGTLRFWEVRHTHLNLTKAQADDIRLVLTAQQKTGVSDAAFTTWIYALELEFIYETTDISLLDRASFETMHDYYNTTGSDGYPISPLLLTGSFVDVDISEAVLTVLAHSQETILFLSNDGQMAVTKWPNYTDTAVGASLVFDSAGGVTGVKELIFDRSKLATSPEISWATRMDQSLERVTAGTGRDTEGVDHATNDRAFRIFVDNKTQFVDHTAKNEQPLERELYNRNREPNVLVGHAINQILYDEPIKTIELSMGHEIFVPQIADIVEFGEVRLGISTDTKWLMAAKTIDLDTMTGEVTLMDREFAVFYLLTTLVTEPDPQGQSSITVSPNQNQYLAEDVITLTANAGGGKTFSAWSGDLTGSTNPDTIIVTRDMFVGATFV